MSESFYANYVLIVCKNGTVAEGIFVNEYYSLEETLQLSLETKLVLTFLYMIQLVGSVILLAFVAYESNGLASHYRTLINQLLSFQHILAVFYADILTGLDLLQAWTGTLSWPLCTFNCWGKVDIAITGSFILMVISVHKFVLVCVWKGIRQMNDDLVARIVIICSLALGTMFTLIACMGPGEGSSCVVIHFFVMVSSNCLILTVI